MDIYGIRKERPGGRGMSEQKPQIVTNFIVRVIIGCAMIFFVNEFLNAQGISVNGIDKSWKRGL